MKKGRYYLFTSEQHEEVRLDYTQKTIERFLELWKEGIPYKQMCKKLMISPTELALIAIDLAYVGKLPERKHGFWGAEEDWKAG